MPSAAKYLACNSDSIDWITSAREMLRCARHDRFTLPGQHPIPFPTNPQYPFRPAQISFPTNPKRPHSYHPYTFLHP